MSVLDPYNQFILEAVAALSQPTGSYKTEIWKHVRANIPQADLKIYTVRLNKLVEKKALEKVKYVKFILSKDYKEKVLKSPKKASDVGGVSKSKASMKKEAKKKLKGVKRS